MARLQSSLDCTVKPVLSGHSQKDQKLVFKTNYCLMQVKSFAKCSPWSILQYFRLSLSYHLSSRSLFCLFLSGRFTHVLLYCPNLVCIDARLLTIIQTLFKDIKDLLHFDRVSAYFSNASQNFPMHKISLVSF